MGSRTAVAVAIAREEFGTRPIYYRRARISRSQGAPALSFDDASGVSSPSAFGTYRVLHQIGSGVLGPVFRSYDSQRDRLVAIKAVKVDLIPEDASRLAEAFRALSDSPAPHPAIVAAIDAGLEGSTPYLALEYASGDALDVSLRQSGPIAVGPALRMLVQLAEAIDASWERGVGHGALHPRDIFTTGTPSEVRVTGFGIAQALEGVGAKSPLRRPYAAPERVAGSAWGRGADVYALAVIAHEVLTGRRPGNAAALGRPLAGEVPGDSAEVWRGVLARALAERPEDRFATAMAMVEALAAVPEEQTQPAPTRPARARRPRATAVDAPRLPGVDDDEEAPLPPPSPPPTPVSITAGADTLNLSLEETPSQEAAAEPELPVAPHAEVEPEMAVELEAAPVVAPAVSAPVEAPIEIDRPVPIEGVTPIDDAEPGEHMTPFPWLATLAVAVAGLVLGGVVGYEVGFGRGKATAIAGLLSSAAAPPAADVAASPPDSPAAVPAPPVPEPGGRLVIQSVPAGAVVYVDGHRVGETPVTVPDVTLGPHDVRVTRSGYAPATERVMLSTDLRSRTLTVRLRRGVGGQPPTAAATGSIDVDSRPRGASVTVDGRRLGQTPLRVPELSPGDYKVLIELAGHKTVTSTVKVVAGEQTRLAVTLEQGERDRVAVPGKLR